MDQIKRILLIMWIATISKNASSDIEQLPNIFAMEGRNAAFYWVAHFSYFKVDWHDGDTSEIIMMSYRYSAMQLTKKSGYNIDYINETDSIGMVLNDINKTDDSGLYTVKVVFANGTTMHSDTNLTVVTADEFDECKHKTHIIANDRNITCGSSSVSPGSVNIKVSLSTNCTLNSVLMVNYSQHSTPDQHIGCSRLAGRSCSFNFSAAPNEEITIVFGSDKWQGGQFECKFSVKGTKPGLTDAQIVGIVIGVVICCGIIIVIIVLVLKKKNIKKDNRTGSRNMRQYPGY